MINLNKFSTENLQKISKVLKIITSQIELVGWNRLLNLIKIPIKTLEKEGLVYEEAKIIISGINQIYENGSIRVINDDVDNSLKGNDSLGGFDLLPLPMGFAIGISKKDLDNYLILRIENREELKDIKENINKKLEEKELNKRKIDDTKKEYKILFDKEKSILIINDRNIKIGKFNDQYHLLRIFFEDIKEIKREWFFSEIAEKYDEVKTLPDKKFYNAIYQINQKIAIETNIKDYFTRTNQSFRINPRYLNNS